MQYFLIIGNINATTYKEVFEALKNNKIRWGVTLGSGKVAYFKVPDDFIFTNERFEVREDGKYKYVNGVNWWTNLVPDKPTPPLKLTKKYNETDYQKYDNFDAINCDRTTNIPYDFYGCVGVPITFLKKYNADQFEIVKFRKGDDDKDLSINGKCPYFRIIIRQKNTLI